MRLRKRKAHDQAKTQHPGSAASDALHLAPAARFSRAARANDALLRPSTERPANTRTPD
jgi:hypothetical protein